MPNGSHLNRSKVSGVYRCYICGDLKDDSEFYSDHTRFNGCSSRCKSCDDHRREERRRGADVKVTPGMAKAISVDNRHAKRQIKKRIEEIKALWDPKAVEDAHKKEGIVRPWTSSENAKLQQMLIAEKSIEEIAKTLRRGKGAIRSHIQAVRLEPAKVSGWGDEDDKLLKTLMLEGLPLIDIYPRMNRSVGVVGKYYRTLIKDVIEVERKVWQPSVRVGLWMSVQEMRAADLTIDEIAEVTGKSTVDVFKEVSNAG